MDKGSLKRRFTNAKYFNFFFNLEYFHIFSWRWVSFSFEIIELNKSKKMRYAVPKRAKLKWNIPNKNGFKGRQDVIEHAK